MILMSYDPFAYTQTLTVYKNQEAIGTYTLRGLDEMITKALEQAYLMHIQDLFISMPEFGFEDIVNKINKIKQIHYAEMPLNIQRIGD